MDFPVTLAAFRVRFKEAPEDDALVQAVLDDAELEIDERVWGAKAATGHAYLVAHRLGMTPYGRDARLKADETKTTYGVMFDELAQRVGGAYRVELE